MHEDACSDKIEWSSLVVDDHPTLQGLFSWSIVVDVLGVCNLLSNSSKFKDIDRLSTGDGFAEPSILTTCTLSASMTSNLDMSDISDMFLECPFVAIEIDLRTGASRVVLA